MLNTTSNVVFFFSFFSLRIEVPSTTNNSFRVSPGLISILFTVFLKLSEFSMLSILGTIYRMTGAVFLRFFFVIGVWIKMLSNVSA